MLGSACAGRGGAVVLGVAVLTELVVVLGLKVRAGGIEQQHVAGKAQVAGNGENTSLQLHLDAATSS